MKLCFATNNPHKLAEIKQMLGDGFELLSLEDIGCQEELPEEHETLEDNSRQKAEYVFENYKVNAFADDTGLEVDALGGAPGVYSARYAGSKRDVDRNIDLLFKNLSTKSDRSAQFRSVITIFLNGEEYQFEGVVRGRIAEERSSTRGFAYDSVFIPEGYDITFSEMSISKKNEMSHRAEAFKKLNDFLSKLEAKTSA